MTGKTALRRPAFLLAAFGLLATVGARATSYTILTTADDVLVNGNCTLREALRAARDDAPVDACAAGTSFDTIVLPAGTYPFGGEEVLNGSGTLRIHGQTFDPFAVRIDLGNAGRFLSLWGLGSYEIRGVEIANGWTGGGTEGEASTRLPCRSRSATSASWRTTPASGAARSPTFRARPPPASCWRAGPSPATRSRGADPTAKMGGAAHLEVTGGARADLRDVAFLGNSAAETGSGGAVAKGGALYVSASGQGRARAWRAPSSSPTRSATRRPTSGAGLRAGRSRASPGTGAGSRSSTAASSRTALPRRGSEPSRIRASACRRASRRSGSIAACSTPTARLRRPTRGISCSWCSGGPPRRPR